MTAVEKKINKSVSGEHFVWDCLPSHSFYLSSRQISSALILSHAKTAQHCEPSHQTHRSDKYCQTHKYGKEK